MTDPMNGRWADLDTGPVASAAMIRWHAPKTWEAIRDAVITEMAARGWEHADRGSLAIVFDKVREAGFTAGLHAARETDRLGYVVLASDERGPAYVLDDIYLDRKVAAETAKNTVHGDSSHSFTVAELHEAEEAD